MELIIGFIIGAVAVLIGVFAGLAMTRKAQKEAIPHVNERAAIPTNILDEWLGGPKEGKK